MSTIEIENLVLYKVNQQRHATKKYVPLIKNLSATFESGKINAIMGPNGSSKTTLLNILYGLCEPSTKTSGRILYNGKERSAGEWFSSASYSEQNVFSIEDQTVLEAIQFAMSLRVANGKDSEADPEEKVRELVKHLQLEKVVDSKISVVSGGERKRTMIAIEMAMGRKILILDEPTSDLDSHLAYNVTKYLRDLARVQDMIVIITVHQPSPQLFNIFDNFLFMYEGMQVYSGPASDIVKTMSSKGIVQPSGWTTAEFLFEAFGEASSFENIEALRQDVNRYIKELDNSWQQNQTKLHQKNEPIQYGRLNLKHVWLLARRQFIRDIRLMYFFMRMVIIVGVQLLRAYGTLNTGVMMPSDVPDTSMLVQNPLKSSNPGALLLVVCNMLSSLEFSKMFYLLFDGSLTFATKEQLSREISKNFYSPLSLYVATIAVETASNLAVALMVLGGIAAMGLEVVNIHLVAMVLCQAVFFVPTTLFIKLLQERISEINRILSQMFGFVKFLFGSASFFTWIPLLLSSFLPNPMVVFSVLAWVIFPLCPVHLMDLFIMGSFENKVVDELFGGDHSASTTSLKGVLSVLGSLADRASINPSWYLGGFVASFLLISSLTPTLFVLCFNAKTRLRMGKE